MSAPVTHETSPQVGEGVGESLEWYGRLISKHAGGGSVPWETDDDKLRRIANALERIATALEPAPTPTNPKA